ncbi:hypothetical protein RJ639_047624 [Escallonia herrerae]|uniref:Fanconi-associated nuclease n=1 Tax=Escallonia herrerae TaxID=1293975 RepID=A0AA88W889_9ASTE|nr:hypothetical protein RJ639_047624 [Escallonia herrerae]
MLTGRESLVRLVGKRRKFLPNRHSLLPSTTTTITIQVRLCSCPPCILINLEIRLPLCSYQIFSAQIQSTLNLCKDGNAESASVVGAEQSQWQHDKDTVEMSSSDWVTCPVCGDKVEGQDSTINSHLDACLARGTKRKLSQCTLLQLNFCSRSKVKVHSTESVDIGANMVQTSLENDPGGDISNNFFYFGVKEDEIVPHKSPLKTTYVEHKVGSGENVCDGNLNSRDESSLLLPKTEMPKNDVAECVEEISGLFLATFIVGRRFADEVELSPGASVSLLRDPTNSKDHNAIKVHFFWLCSFCSLKGCITSVPERGLAVVPLEVVCRNKISFGEIESDDLQDFRFLWKQAFHVVESARPYLPSMVKCQQNFVLLMQEVLGTNAHLFTFDEKTFLETFISLSDDSQRLFIRLYTRKGPWFRMGNISYSDLFDCKQVVKELSVSGYILLVQSVDELQKDDLEEFMNMLTVGELCDILCAINKVIHMLNIASEAWILQMDALSVLNAYQIFRCLYGLDTFRIISPPLCHDEYIMFQKRNRGFRKQDLIASLLSLYGNGLCPFLPRAVLENTGACIRISSRAESLIWRAERLFFLNGGQDLSAFLLVDLGIVKYPTYNCIISDQIFSCRSDLLAYEEAIEVAQIMDESLDENHSVLVLRCIEVSESRMSGSSTKAIQSSTSGSLASFFACFSASWVYSVVILLGTSFLEHGNRYNDAINLLKRLLTNFNPDRRRGYWTLRLSVDLEHMGRLNESLSVAEDGLLDPCVRAGSRVSLQQRVLRLGKPPRRWRTPSYSLSVKRKITEVITSKPVCIHVTEYHHPNTNNYVLRDNFKRYSFNHVMLKVP